MELGFITSILADYSFEEVIDFASDNGFRCVELACWPAGKAERRYAGVSHLDVESLDEKQIAYVQAYCQKKCVKISSLAYYPNPMDRNLEKQEVAVKHLYRVIDASAKLGVNMVTTFIGRVENLSLEENLELVASIWKPILRYAKERNVRVAIENCPMLFDRTQWPGGQNIFTSPRNWREVFSRLPFDNLGINYDPSHFIWQGIDYIAPIYEFRDRIFHVHVKDIKLHPDKLKEVGIMGYPLEYMSPKLPGLGDVNWGKYISALTDIGYDSYVCLEIEDRAFERDKRDIENSLILSKRYIEQYVI